MRKATVLQIAVILAAVGAVELLCRVKVIDRFTMIPPSEMALVLAQLPWKANWFWPDTLYTLRNIGAAVFVAVLGGFLIAILVHSVPRLRRVMDPIFASYYAVPTFILYPLLIVLFGIGAAPLIAMGAIFGIVGMISATITALDRIPPVLLKIGRLSHMGPVRTALLLKLPAITPHLLTGIKLTVAYCIVGTIAGEFILATAGIGRRLSLSYNDFDNRTMYAVILMIIAFAAVVNTLLGAFERRVRQRWYG